MNRQNLRLPTCLLLDANGNVVKVYRDRVDIEQIVKDATAIDVSQTERLTERCRSRERSIPACLDATTCRMGESFSIRASRRPR